MWGVNHKNFLENSREAVPPAPAFRGHKEKSFQRGSEGWVPIPFLIQSRGREINETSIWYEEHPLWESNFPNLLFFWLFVICHLWVVKLKILSHAQIGLLHYLSLGEFKPILRQVSSLPLHGNRSETNLKVLELFALNGVLGKMGNVSLKVLEKSLSFLFKNGCEPRW